MIEIELPNPICHQQLMFILAVMSKSGKTRFGSHFSPELYASSLMPKIGVKLVFCIHSFSDHHIAGLNVSVVESSLIIFVALRSSALNSKNCVDEPATRRYAGDRCVINLKRISLLGTHTRGDNVRSE